MAVTRAEIVNAGIVAQVLGGRNVNLRGLLKKRFVERIIVGVP